MTTRLRHLVEPEQQAALCGWEPTPEELRAQGPGWIGHPGWPRCTVCGDLWRPERERVR